MDDSNENGLVRAGEVLANDLKCARATAMKYTTMGFDGREREWPDKFSYLFEVASKFGRLCDLKQLLQERMITKGRNVVLEIFSDGTPEYEMLIADPPLATGAVAVALSDRSFVSHEKLKRVQGDIYSDETWVQARQRLVELGEERYAFVIGKPNMGWIIEEEGKERPPSVELYAWLLSQMYTVLDSNGGVLLLENDHGFNGDAESEELRCKGWFDNLRKSGIEISVDDKEGFNVMIKRTLNSPDRLPKVELVNAS